MTGNVWVVAEPWRGCLSEITYEALALGRELADALGSQLEAVLMGHKARDLTATLGKANSVLYLDHPLLAEPLVEPCAEALAHLVESRGPRCVLLPLTNVSLGLGTLLAAKRKAPAINFCTDVRVVDGRIETRTVLYGGKIECTVTVTGEPAILGLWPGSRRAELGRAVESPPVEDVPVSLPETTAVRLMRYLNPEAGDVDLTRQDVLVAVGRGIQSRDNLPLAEHLAKVLGGAVCASRPVIDQGWLPLSRQVGKSGLTVKPKLYLAIGVSGAPEHVEGMRDSGLIVAVNTDRHAPIFNLAHYGVVADALELLPSLTAAVEARKGVGSHA